MQSQINVHTTEKKNKNCAKCRKLLSGIKLKVPAKRKPNNQRKRRIQYNIHECIFLHTFDQKINKLNKKK